MSSGDSGEDVENSGIEQIEEDMENVKIQEEEEDEL